MKCIVRSINRVVAGMDMIVWRNRVNKILLYLRLAFAIIGIFIFYTFVHEFAYQQYIDVSPAESDTLSVQPDSPGND